MNDSETTPSDLTLQLSDGRRLGYQILGAPDGHPLIFFHGTPGSRRVFGPDDLLATLPGVRLILPDRPGYGLSDPRPGRTLLHWAKDVEALADHLGLGRFTVGGVSGGGPYALACAHRLSERLHAVILLASPAPMVFRGATRGMALGNRIGIWLGRWAPGLVRRLTAGQREAFLKDPPGYVEALARQLSAPDRQILADASARQAIVTDLTEAFRQGPDAAFEDGQLAMSTGSWGFALEEIHVPVHLWHGEADTLAPIPMAHYLASQLPHCTPRYLPDTGHLLPDVPEVVQEIGDVLSELQISFPGE